MPRNRVRKTNIGMHSEEQMRSALDLISRENQSIRSVAKLKGIPYPTVRRYWQKFKNTDEPIRLTPNYEVNKIFTAIQEEALANYIVKCSQMFYGLTLLECRQLAYEMAIVNNVKIPEKWNDRKLAGMEWLYNFRKRHPRLSLRTPEGCSLSRATSFNRHNVNIFYDKLQEVMLRKPEFADGTRIYNLDETSSLTVQKSQKVLAAKGQKQVSKVTSGEKGTLVTTCCIVNASGNFLPPVMIFPRVHFKHHMTNGAPTGTLGLATQSGWMNSTLFVDTMEHFIKFSNTSKENPSLLIMDNFEAHICIKAIELAKENGVTILTVPPHSTGKMQPLDVCLYKPFKTAYNAAVDSWMMRNPGKPLTIYEVAACVGDAHMKAMTPSNICSSFKNTGIFPYDRNVFTDIDFLPSEVTNRPITENNGNTPDGQIFNSENPLAVGAEHSRSRTPDSEAEISLEFVTPDQFRGLPKAGPRKNTRKPRRKGKSMIATDTPEKMEIEEREAEKQRKKKAHPIKKKVFQEPEDTTDEEDTFSVHSEVEDYYESGDEENIMTSDSFNPLEKLPSEGDYVLVEFNGKNGKVYYVAKVLQEAKEQEVEVSFLRRNYKMENTFRLPDVLDVSPVALSDVKLILPKPTICGNTKRQQSFYSFKLNFTQIDIR